MAKAKLHQIKLVSPNHSQPPFPGGWVLNIFKAAHAFAPELVGTHDLPVSQRTRERIQADDGSAKQSTYDKIEAILIELTTALFPKVSAVNGFAKKYVNEYFRLWKSAGDFAPTWVKCLGFEPGESLVLGRALARDFVLRLCYLESCERRLSKLNFSEAELALLRHDSPAEVYQALISDRAQHPKMSQEKLAERLKLPVKSLQRFKRGENIPPFRVLLELTPLLTCHRLLAGIGFVDQLLKTLGLHNSVLCNEFLAIASVFIRNHPAALEAFNGAILQQSDSGTVQREKRGFEGYIAFGEHLLLHPGFKELYPELPDALWRAHLYSLQFARVVDLAQAYIQYAKPEGDHELTNFLDTAERKSKNSPYGWMDELRRSSENQNTN